MANKDKPGPGSKPAKSDIKTDEPTAVDGDNKSAGDAEGTDSPEPVDTTEYITLPGGEKVDKEFFELQQRYAREDFERNTGASATALAVEAFKRFDPKEQNIQLSEHYVYRDREFDESGHF